MLERALIIPGLCVALCLPLGVSAKDAVVTAHRLQERALVLAPYPFIKLCHNRPDQCEAKHGKTEVALDQRDLQRLATINATVNHSIRPRNDPPGTDNWSLDVTSGDCEDYALAKRRELIESGLSARAIRLAVGTTREGEAHAVVIVRTDKGDIALDNSSDIPKPANRLSIAWTKIESSNNPKIWYSLSSASP